MTKFRLQIGIILLVTGIFFTGCYTQMATRDYDRERYSTYEEENSGDYYESESDTSYSGSYEDENYEDGEVTINNYYGVPGYRRYLWGYYPSITIGAYWGSVYDPFYYDPFCYDPFFYNYWCYPVHWSYNPFYSFPSYYYYGYNGYYPHHYYGGGGGYTYRERSNDMYRVRNGGTRGDIRDRSLVTRNTTGGTLLRNSGERERLSTRNKTESRENSVRRREINRETTKDIRRNETKRPDEKVITRKNTERTERKTIKREQNTNDNTRIERRTETGRKNTIKRQGPTGNQTPKQYQPPRRNDSPRTYSPPRNNGGTQRNSTPPRTNTSPRGGGNNDSGRRTR